MYHSKRGDVVPGKLSFIAISAMRIPVLSDATFVGWHRRYVSTK